MVDRLFKETKATEIRTEPENSGLESIQPFDRISGLPSKPIRIDGQIIPQDHITKSTDEDSAKAQVIDIRSLKHTDKGAGNKVFLHRAQARKEAA